MAASPSNYSALLRRSKLASYNPHIDQVYTAAPSSLARSNFGFKRPLPSASTKTSPFVRLTQLDSHEGRTVFRKATREAKFVRQWQETGVGIQSAAFVPSNGGRKWDRLEIQSRFVDGAGPGAVKEVTDSKAGTTSIPRMPNVFELGEFEFDRFLEELGEKRQAFIEFVVAETNKQTSASGVQLSVEEFDLYDHAQRQPTEIIRLVERFLRSTSASSSLNSAPLPQTHPTLALQYATPTPLESALAPPVRGRLLGQAPVTGNGRNYNSFYGNNKTDMYASVLSTIAVVPGTHTANAASTTFYPDATGVRSNAPGRASFRLNPTINPTHHALRTSVTSSSALSRQSYDFRPPTAEYEPATLALKSLDLRPTVVPSSAESTALPGTPAYSGNAPQDLRKYGSGAKRPQSLTDLWASAGSPSRLGLGGQTQPRNLLQAKQNRRTKEQQENWVRTRENLLADRAADAKQYGAKEGGSKQQKNQGKKAQGGKKALLEKLSALLEKKGGEQ